MASYQELRQILTDSVAGAQALRDKVGVGCLIAANAIIAGDDDAAPWDQTAGAHDQRVKWVIRLLATPESVTREMFQVVIAANASATQAQILSASDAAIQSAVNATIDVLSEHLP